MKKDNKNLSDTIKRFRKSSFANFIDFMNWEEEINNKKKVKDKKTVTLIKR